jgi:hypothetical protein
VISTQTQATSTKSIPRDTPYSVVDGFDDASFRFRFFDGCGAASVGRTARAGRTGTSLSFVVPRSLWGKQKKNDVSLETPQAILHSVPEALDLLKVKLVLLDLLRLCLLRLLEL